MSSRAAEAQHPMGSRTSGGWAGWPSGTPCSRSAAPRRRSAPRTAPASAVVARSRTLAFSIRSASATGRGSAPRSRRGRGRPCCCPAGSSMPRGSPAPREKGPGREGLTQQSVPGSGPPYRPGARGPAAFPILLAALGLPSPARRFPLAYSSGLSLARSVPASRSRPARRFALARAGLVAGPAPAPVPLARRRFVLGRAPAGCVPRPPVRSPPVRFPRPLCRFARRPSLIDVRLLVLERGRWHIDGAERTLPASNTARAAPIG